MPGTYIPESEVEACGGSVVKGGGNLYLEKGRKYIGMKVRYFVMKED